MWVRENDSAGVEWCPELGAEAASVSSPPFYPTPCLFSEPAWLVAVRGDVKKELPGLLRFSQLAHEEDEQDNQGKGESAPPGSLGTLWAEGLQGRTSHSHCLEGSAQSRRWCSSFPGNRGTSKEWFLVFELRRRRWSRDSSSLGTPNDAFSTRWVMNRWCLTACPTNSKDCKARNESLPPF